MPQIIASRILIKEVVLKYNELMLSLLYVMIEWWPGQRKQNHWDKRDKQTTTRLQNVQNIKTDKYKINKKYWEKRDNDYTTKCPKIKNR